MVSETGKLSWQIGQDPPPTPNLAPTMLLQLLGLKQKSGKLNLVSVGRQILIEKFISNKMRGGKRLGWQGISFESLLITSIHFNSVKHLIGIKLFKFTTHSCAWNP